MSEMVEVVIDSIRVSLMNQQRIVILREVDQERYLAIWVGVYGATLAWLQIARILTPSLAFLLALGFVLIEYLLRLREKSQWSP